MARLIVIKGSDEGKQFSLNDSVASAGRDSSSRIRLMDTEVSRRHAEFFRTPEGHRVRDVGSANGTFVNGQSIRDVLLQPGDHVQIGQTVLVYTPDRGESSSAEDLAQRINLITRQDVELTNSIIKTIGETEGSRIMSHPDQVEGPWQRDAHALGVLYEATQLISHTLDLSQLLENILELVFRALGADRGCILLRSEDGEPDSPTGEQVPLSSSGFQPRAIRWRNEHERDEKLPISRTLVDHVLRERRGILVSDVMRDERFQAVQSIVRSGIREVICVPMKGRHQTLGVLYLDCSTPASPLGLERTTGKFTGDHLSLAIAIAHQAALAVEETRYYQAMMHAERLAAVGQTVAALSHHIKNILQGLKTGGELLEMGIHSQDQELLKQGWRIVGKNQGKIQELVLDMLSYSKEREPAIAPTNLNRVAEDVIELLQQRCTDMQVSLEKRLDPRLPLVPADAEGIHRALLNIVSNALDALDESDHRGLVLTTTREHEEGANPDADWALIHVTDTGPGIPPDKIQDIFRPFVSTKGSKGTGLGLAVSRKILREHGGDLTVTSQTGKGCTFTFRLPMRMTIPEELDKTMVPTAPPPD